MALSTYRAQKIFSLQVAESFGPKTGAIFLVAFCFIMVAIVRQEKADKKPASKLRAKNERKEKEKINELHHEKRDTDDIASF